MRQDELCVAHLFLIACGCQAAGHVQIVLARCISAGRSKQVAAKLCFLGITPAPLAAQTDMSSCFQELRTNHCSTVFMVYEH